MSEQSGHPRPDGEREAAESVEEREDASPAAGGPEADTGDAESDGERRRATASADEADLGARREPRELRGEDLALGYPSTEEPVVECETVLLPAGEVTAIVGPNGSGKSTLLRAMADQLAPESGVVTLDGEAVERMDTKTLARQLGLLSQERDAPDSITVENLVYHGRYPHRGFFESVSERDRAAVDRAIALAGVEHLRDVEMGSLSGGQKQLAWIAMILAQETDVLLLDEPTTFLDLHHQLRVMEVVETLNEKAGVTVGVVLHDVGQAARFADNLVAMCDGEPYDWGPPDDVVTEELLADVFAVDATVDIGSPTGPHIAPHRALEEE